MGGACWHQLAARPGTPRTSDSVGQPASTTQRFSAGPFLPSTSVFVPSRFTVMRVPFPVT